MFLFTRMKDLDIPMTSVAAVFGQSYGMCDHVSYTLGKFLPAGEKLRVVGEGETEEN